jgi:hypothetical protein
MAVEPQPGLRFVCFTDCPDRLSAKGWELLPLASPRHVMGGHFINRYHKFFAHRLFAQARWSIYIDGNLDRCGDFAGLVQALQHSCAGFGAFRHPHGHSLAREVEVCGLGAFDAHDRAVIDSQIAQYLAAGINMEAQILAAYLIVRDHYADGLDRAMQLWWSQICRFARRDQISLPYVLKTSGLEWVALDDTDAAVSALPERRAHARPSLMRRIKRRLARIGLRGPEARPHS